MIIRDIKEIMALKWKFKFLFTFRMSQIPWRYAR